MSSNGYFFGFQMETWSAHERVIECVRDLHFASAWSADAKEVDLKRDLCQFVVRRVSGMILKEGEVRKEAKLGCGSLVDAYLKECTRTLMKLEEQLGGMAPEGFDAFIMPNLEKLFHRGQVAGLFNDWLGTSEVVASVAHLHFYKIKRLQEVSEFIGLFSSLCTLKVVDCPNVMKISVGVLMPPCLDRIQVSGNPRLVDFAFTKHLKRIREMSYVKIEANPALKFRVDVGRTDRGFIHKKEGIESGGGGGGGK
ncbi:MAG: hypothetical protein SP1CHLAM54_09210 [Chlamydiia bacterium]|nr:hypothetical protein [Chlamydiia bacterium]MCH9615827.1 hypothetical protein [Chlamydiia bacterium]MCH9628770.1 hypothetical protein [Chlamydiia bacterium]